MASLLRIVTTRDRDAAILRRPAREVEQFDRDLKRLLHAMVDTMREAPGVGLAAPQVGVDLRAIVVETVVQADGEAETFRLHQMLNPRIVWHSEALEEDQEACLSVPGLYGDVPRHVAVRVQGRDASGRAMTVEADGFEARVFQHEIDHLDGILFPDRVTGLDKLYTLRKLEDGTYERVPYSPPL
jgi:peptide deformylase